MRHSINLVWIWHEMSSPCSGTLCGVKNGKGTPMMMPKRDLFPGTNNWTPFVGCAIVQTCDFFIVSQTLPTAFDVSRWVELVAADLMPNDLHCHGEPNPQPLPASFLGSILVKMWPRSTTMTKSLWQRCFCIAKLAKLLAWSVRWCFSTFLEIIHIFSFIKNNIFLVRQKWSEKKQCQNNVRMLPLKWLFQATNHINFLNSAVALWRGCPPMQKTLTFFLFYRCHI